MFEDSFLSGEVADSSGLFPCVFLLWDGSIMPETTGAGNMSASVALRANWREKSLACHHSRNFKANIEAGRKNRNDERIFDERFCGLNIPTRLWPCRDCVTALLGFDFGCMAIAMAR